MKAIEKIKLSKERVNLIADLKNGALKGMAKIKASKRIVEIVTLLGGDSADVAPVVLTGKEFGEFDDTEEGKAALREVAKAVLMQMRGKPVYCPALKSDVDIEREGANKITSLSGDSRKLTIVTAIQKLIVSSKKMVTKPPYSQGEIKKGVVAYHIMKNKITLASQDLFVRFVIKEKVGGHFQYDYMLHEDESIFADDEKQNALQESKAFDATNYKSADQLEPTLLAGSRPDALTRTSNISFDSLDVNHGGMEL